MQSTFGFSPARLICALTIVDASLVFGAGHRATSSAYYNYPDPPPEVYVSGSEDSGDQPTPVEATTLRDTSRTLAYGHAETAPAGVAANAIAYTIGGGSQPLLYQEGSSSAEYHDSFRIQRPGHAGEFLKVKMALSSVMVGSASGDPGAGYRGMGGFEIFVGRLTNNNPLRYVGKLDNAGGTLNLPPKVIEFEVRVGEYCAFDLTAFAGARNATYPNYADAMLANASFGASLGLGGITEIRDSAGELVSFTNGGSISNPLASGTSLQADVPISDGAVIYSDSGLDFTVAHAAPPLTVPEPSMMAGVLVTISLLTGRRRHRHPD